MIVQLVGIPVCPVAAEAAQVKLPGVEVTVYPVMAAPPSLSGAVHEMTAEPVPGTTDEIIGTPGTFDGVAVAVPPSPSPARLAAETEIKYDTPLVRPLTTQVVVFAVAVVHCPSTPPSGLVAVTTYWSSGDPPVEVVAVHVTVVAPLAFEAADTFVGAPGTLATGVEAEALEAAPVPEALVAVTEKV